MQHGHCGFFDEAILDDTDADFVRRKKWLTQVC